MTCLTPPLTLSRRRAAVAPRLPWRPPDRQTCPRLRRHRYGAPLTKESQHLIMLRHRLKFWPNGGAPGEAPAASPTTSRPSWLSSRQRRIPHLPRMHGRRPRLRHQTQRSLRLSYKYTPPIPLPASRTYLTTGEHDHRPRCLGAADTRNARAIQVGWQGGGGKCRR